MDKSTVYNEYVEFLINKDLEAKAIAVIYDKDLNKNLIFDVEDIKELISEVFHEVHYIEIIKLSKVTKIKLYRDRIQKCNEISINKKDKIIYIRNNLNEHTIHFKDKKAFTKIKNYIKKELSKLIFS